MHPHCTISRRVLVFHCAVLPAESATVSSNPCRFPWEVSWPCPLARGVRTPPSRTTGRSRDGTGGTVVFPTPVALTGYIAAAKVSSLLLFYFGPIDRIWPLITFNSKKFDFMSADVFPQQTEGVKLVVNKILSSFFKVTIFYPVQDMSF